MRNTAWLAKPRGVSWGVLMVLLMVTSSMPVSGQQSNTLALVPADTTLNIDAKNYSTDPRLTVYTWPDYMAANSILLKFDLSSLPTGAVITSATLNLTLQQSDAGTNAGYVVTAHRVQYGNPVVERATGVTSDGTAPWTSSACCSGGVPLAQGDIGEAEDAETIDATPGLKSWNLTDMARQWLANPNSNLGVLLNPDVAARRDSFRSFASAESTDPRIRPSLTVTFTAPDAQPPSVSVTGPAPGATVSQTVLLKASASDNSGVVGLQFYVNGVPVSSVQQSAPYALNWNTASVSDGSYTINAVAIDGSKNVGVSQGLAVTVQNGTIVVQPEDTSLNINASNYSKDPTLKAFTWPDKRTAIAILLKFDLSSVPAGSVITSATLRMAQVESDSTADTYAVTASKVIGRNPIVARATGYTADGVTPWAPSSCCNGGVPLAQGDIASAEDRQTLDRSNGFKSWTITHMVQDWVDRPSTNFGLLLNPDGSKLKDRYRYFASMEEPNSALRPYLQVTYTPKADSTPPQITALAASSPTSATASITWTTNEASDTQVDYGVTTGYGQTTSPAATLVTAHAVSLGGLQPSTTYHFRARSRDASANLATSGDFSFTTRPAAIGDLTPPTVSLSSPAAGATVSGTTTVSASATDAVGVIGVQFRVDGSALGAEDTSAPYAANWTTTAVANGAHTLTAVARDAAGNQATSATVTVTVSNGGPASTPAVFQSNWDTASGSSSNAVNDGGRWPNYWEFNSGSGVQLLSVVAAGVNGHNALKVLQRGSHYAANLQIDNVVPQSRDYYLRYYMKNDDTSSAGDHIVTADTYQYSNLTFMRKSGSTTGWTFVSSFYGCGYTYPIGHWGPTQKLANGQWYRFEYFVHFLDSTHVQVHPRVYDAAGTLLYSDADFRQSDFGSSSWNGRSDWTLSSYYAAGQGFCVDPQWVNDFGLGNNGQQFAVDTGLAWYFAAVEVRTDRWPGPVAAR